MIKPRNFYLLSGLGMLALSMLALNGALFWFGYQARSELASLHSSAEQSAELAATYVAGLEALAALDRNMGDPRLSEMLQVLEAVPALQPLRSASARAP